ncbi:M28 family peptidase [Salinirarus marinus]|uniref:M28 family peptidase n=1 Tax=Salinirarus marinus TaxID=3068310 RepID=UPI003C6C51BF
MTTWIGETFTSDVGWSHLERLVDVGDRMAGTAGERAGLEATRDALADVGARDARIDDFEIQGWIRGDSAVRAGGETHDCIALPRSPAATAEGTLVDLGDGLPADFDRDLTGALVLVSDTVPDYFDRTIHRREKYYRAVEAGAAGFLFRSHLDGCLAPTGSVGSDDSPIGEIPAVGVSKEVGRRLSRRFGGDRVELAVDCETPPAKSGNVHAALGPDTEAELLVTSHVDAHDVAEGALDNGAGTATLVEVARALAAREAELDTRVRFVPFGAEEVGLQGSSREAARVDVDEVTAVVNLDGVCRARTIQVHTHGFADLGDATEAAADRFDHPVSVVPRQTPHSDHWPFVARGVPGLMVGSDASSRGRGWGHTAADTLDKLDVRTLRESAIVLTELVVDLASEDRTVARRRPDAIAADLEAEGEAEGLRLTGDWPF